MTAPYPDVFVSVLSPSHRGELAGPSFPQPAEDLFQALVLAPEPTVSFLAEDDDWPKRQAFLVDALVNAPDKKARDAVKSCLPALVPARFSGTRRVAAECLGRQVIMHDFDGVSADTFDEACERIRAQLPDRFLAIHTTASERNPDGAWRLRAIEILDREATPDEWERRVKPHMRSISSHDKQALDIARLLYLPVRTPGYQAKVYEGPRTKLDEIACTAEAAVTQAPSTERAPAQASLRDNAALLIGKNWPASGNRADARLALVGACVRSGWPREAAADFVKRVHEHVPDRGDATDDSLEDMVVKAIDKQARGERLMGWPSLGNYIGHAVASAAKDWLTLPDPEGAAQFEQLINKPKDAPSPSPKGNEGIFWDNWDEPLPPVKWLVEGLIPKGTVGAFVAHGSSLKTWTMLSMAAAIAKGQAWLDKYPVTQGKVVILDYESGRYELRRRVLLLEKGKVVGLGAWSYPEKRIDDVSFWVDLGNEPGIALVCVDSLAEGTSPGVDENSKDASYPLQLAAKFTEATGASVLFVHHSKKDDSGDARKVVRGSTAIYAAMDWCFAFENVADTQGYRRMLMTSIKPCMGAKPPPVPLELTDKGLSTFEVGDKPTKTSPPAQIQAAIRLALAGGPVETKAKLATEIGIRREIVVPELDAMVVKGEVVFLKGQGFALDSDERRRQRVLDAVSKHQNWKGDGALAKAADVDTETVASCFREGALVRSADGRYLVVARQSTIE